jgi:hypothetical protein
MGWRFNCRCKTATLLNYKDIGLGRRNGYQVISCRFWLYYRAFKNGFDVKEANLEIDTVNRITPPEQFYKEFKLAESKAIDVCRESEYEAEHIDEAFIKPLAYINEWIRHKPRRTFLFTVPAVIDSWWRYHLF